MMPDDLYQKLSTLREEYRGKMNAASDRAERAAADGEMDEVSIASTESSRFGAAFVALNRAIAIVESAHPEPRPKTLTLPLVWEERGNANGDARLMLGPVKIGETMFMPKSGVWWALYGSVMPHRPTGHATREAAQAALEEAVVGLEVKSDV